jgi:putative addiction module CopG family antidote
MSIVLSPDVERQIEELVRSGRFESVDDCIRKSVQLMHDREIAVQQRKHELQQMVEEGVKDFEEGRFTVYDDESLEARIQQIAREGREKLNQQAAAK